MTQDQFYNHVYRALHPPGANDMDLSDYVEALERIAEELDNMIETSKLDLETQGN